MANLFDDFGFDFGELEEVKPEEKKEVKKTPAKAEKKPEKKKAEKKKAAADSEAEKKLILPVTVKMPFKTLKIDGEGELTVKEIFAKVWQQGYKEICCFHWIVEESVIYVGVDTIGHKSDRRTGIILDKPVEIHIGDLRCEYNVSHFDGEEEVSLEEVVGKFTYENPRFAGAEWIYQAECNVLTPVFDGFPEKTKEKDCIKQGMDSLSVFGGKTPLSAESDTMIKNLPEEIGEGYSYIFGQIDKTLFATVKLPPKSLSVKIRDEWVVNKDAKEEVLEEKYALPVRLSVFTIPNYPEITLTADDFGGQTKITGADVREFLKKDIAAFGDSRELDCFYSKSQNLLSVGIHSGTKGAVVSAGQSVWDDMWEAEEFLEEEYEDEDDDDYPIYKTCPLCGKEHLIHLTCAEYIEYDTKNPQRIPIQKIFPNMNKWERDFISSGTCPKCWSGMLGEDVPEGLRIEEV